MIIETTLPTKEQLVLPSWSRSASASASSLASYRYADGNFFDEHAAFGGVVRGLSKLNLQSEIFKSLAESLRKRGIENEAPKEYIIENYEGKKELKWKYKEVDLTEFGMGKAAFVGFEDDGKTLLVQHVDQMVIDGNRHFKFNPDYEVNDKGLNKHGYKPNDYEHAPIKGIVEGYYKEKHKALSADARLDNQLDPIKLLEMIVKINPKTSSKDALDVIKNVGIINKEIAQRKEKFVKEQGISLAEADKIVEALKVYDKDISAIYDKIDPNLGKLLDGRR